MKHKRLILDEPHLAPTLDLLHTLRDPPDHRQKIHTLMALYAFSPPGRRTVILDEVEEMIMNIAVHLASELADLRSR